VNKTQNNSALKPNSDPIERQINQTELCVSTFHTYIAMIRQNVRPFLKRNLRCRQGFLYRQHDVSKFIPREQHSLRPRVRVSSTTSSAATRGAGLVAPATEASIASSRQQLQRTMNLFSQDSIRDVLPIIGNGAYMVSE